MAWVKTGNIKGPPGPQGPDGPAGVDGAEGPQGIQGPQGPQGAQGLDGAQGPAGQSTQIVGSFGASKTPADLPADGLIPADWDAPGNPAAAMQFGAGEAMTYSPANSADPLYGHLYQYDGTSTWADIGAMAGPQGPAGDPGVQGPQGDQGPAGVTGVDGAAGPRGSIWHSMAGDPTGVLTSGNYVGDISLDTDSGDVWEWQ